MQGIVRWFDESKGYGFIRRDTGGDVFVHHSAIQMDGFKTLEKDQNVDMDIDENAAKGPMATRVFSAFEES